MDAGVPLTLYAVNGTTRTAITTVTLPAVPSGKAIEGSVFDLTIDDIGTHGWVLSVDDDTTGGNGTVFECDETNNEYPYLDNPC